MRCVQTVSHPDFELDLYASRYTGMMKIRRLLFIANICPDHSLRAYQLAIKEIRK